MVDVARMDIQPVDHLIAAILSGDRRRIDQLVGVEPALGYRRNMFGASPIHAARFSGRPELAALLRQPNEPDAFFLAAELGEFQSVARMLERDPTLATDRDSVGATALHGACYWVQTEVAQLLIDSGADVTTATRDEFLQIAPLGSAVATTPGVPQPSDAEVVVVELVRMLLVHGADPNHVRLDGMTALHTAAWRGHAAVAGALIEAGADVGIAARSGPHQGEVPAASALSHLVLASELDPRMRPG
jgi:ankyrin repeat protein